MDKATFRAEDHTYWLNGKQLISVTQLMQKHGLAPDYSGVSSDVLNKKAERGTLIHGEIERFVKHGETGFSGEMWDFVNIANSLGLSSEMQSEVIVNNDLVAGTADLMAQRFGDPVGENAPVLNVLIDFKTVSKIDREAVRWQLSLYERLSGLAFDEFYVFHLCENSEESKAIKLDRIATEEIDRLLECERSGKIYAPKQLVVADDLLKKLIIAEQKIKEAETAKQVAESQRNELKKYLKTAMEQQGVLSFQWDKLKITYVNSYEKNIVDAEKLREEMPDVAKRYTKISNVGATVKITLGA